MTANDFYAKEAQARWPKEYAESNSNLNSISKSDQQKLFEAGTQNIKNMADAFIAKQSAASNEVQELIDIHYNWVCKFWTPTKDAYIGLGKMYVEDSRFSINYDKYAPGCAEFMAQAMHIYAQENLNN